MTKWKEKQFLPFLSKTYLDNYIIFFMTKCLAQSYFIYYILTSKAI